MGKGTERAGRQAQPPRAAVASFGPLGNCFISHVLGQLLKNCTCEVSTSCGFELNGLVGIFSLRLWTRSALCGRVPSRARSKLRRARCNTKKLVRCARGRAR